jgi:hypothetical protein
MVASWVRTNDLRLTCRLSYAVGYCVELIMKKNINHIKTINFEHTCVLNWHAVRHGNNAAQSVDSKSIVFLNSRSYVPAT